MEINKMSLKEIRWEGVDWIHFSRGMDQCLAVVSAVMNI